MSRRARTTEAPRGPVAGPRVTPFSVVTVAFVAVFLLLVLTLIITDISYTDAKSLREALTSREVLHALWLSVFTSLTSVAIIVVFAIPVGYALSRYRFPGHAVVEALVDLPIVLPPVVIGLSLLVFFSTPIGKWIETTWVEFVYSVQGIILCQFIVSASFGIRAAAAAFDSVDRRLENLALTLGCTRGQAFWRVALPMARNGIVAGAIVAWAHAVGLFGPLMIFAGTTRMKTEVLPTTVALELSIGRIEVALAVALVMLAAAAAALVLVHALAGARRWWPG
ncbi:MAG TPA: ABC transporter permease subunit [Planctomycetota bacterium]|nr:ABC transporter permease subunit [Planctomycetota bacterium]